ncbi:hypothetical protein [Ligilactobacillus salivarius]|uniref:DUF1828 domain-containing protein n=1 Tax=Ligilactobacillus salivarius TaxID=1624 RepID=A0ABD6JHU7_9LACO|nr:hypothetical protein [Ligilactobacillus salivarius]MBM6708445.1 hypothetical protein [Ligilactobacillus salivarius]MYU96940.1 hypothetical protein [Ligilactobacillus salivarius]MYV11201.1 hypothetical protein [Ligilactobacillus salivarius]MYZ22891.1 hypothetical protein [Ligilactobacillus salivarius]MYZ66957.1 hypothetical protein [Ligilactobacillus salivarius]
MKINFDRRHDLKDLYQVGNVIRDYTNTLYLIVGNVEDGYAMVNLTNNSVTEKTNTLEELADLYGEDEDVLVNAEINVF